MVSATAGLRRDCSTASAKSAMALASRAALQALSAASTSGRRRNGSGGESASSENALRVEQDRTRAGAGGAGFAKLDFEFAGPAGKGRVDNIFGRQRRRVGNHGGDVFDADLAAAARI